MPDAWRALDGRTHRGRPRTASGSGTPRGARSVGAILRQARGRGEATGPDSGGVTPGLLDIGEHLGRPSITRPKGRSGRVKGALTGARALVMGWPWFPVPERFPRFRELVPAAVLVPVLVPTKLSLGGARGRVMGWPYGVAIGRGAVGDCRPKKKRPRESNPEPWRTAGRLDVSTSKRERAALGVGAPGRPRALAEPRKPAGVGRAFPP